MSSRQAGQLRGRDDVEAPVRGRCEVLSRRRDGAYWTLTFAAKEIAERARPGQFVQIGVDAAHTLLRRPFSIARVSRQGASAGTVDVVFDVHGPGTDWLSRIDAHDTIEVVGPLGKPFPLPQRQVNCLLIGGGYGVAPLFLLAEHLTRQRLRVDMLVGASTLERLVGVVESKRLSASAVFTTDDGSYGEPGQVTDVLDDVLDRTGAGVVYACGPNPMLAAVSQRCAEREVPVQVAVEELMGCGIGVCFTCVLPVRGKDQYVRMKRACVDGPVFNGSRIAWDVSRYGVAATPIAPDATGAPVGDGPVTEDGAQPAGPTADAGGETGVWGQA